MGVLDAWTCFHIVTTTLGGLPDVVVQGVNALDNELVYINVLTKNFLLITGVSVRIS